MSERKDEDGTQDKLRDIRIYIIIYTIIYRYRFCVRKTNFYKASRGSACVRERESRRVRET